MKPGPTKTAASGISYLSPISKSRYYGYEYFRFFHVIEYCFYLA